MARLTIDTGTAGNPATGDTLRTAMTKINANFNELYDSDLLALVGGLSRHRQPMVTSNSNPTARESLKLIVYFSQVTT